MGNTINPEFFSNSIFSRIEPFLEDLKQFHDLYTDLDSLPLEKNTVNSIGEKLLALEKQAVLNFQMELDVSRDSSPLNVAIIGSFSAGKSSTINSLLGIPICPVKVSPNTSAITRFQYSDTPRVIKTLPSGESFDLNHDEYYKSIEFHDGKNDECIFDYFYPFNAFRDLVLIDTPGFTDIEHENNSTATFRAIDNADALIYILDINTGTPTADEISLITSLVKPSNKSCLLLINKADCKAPSARETVKNSITETTNDLFTNVFLYSAVNLMSRTLPIQQAMDHILEKISQESENTNQWDVILHCSADEVTKDVHVNFDGLVSAKGKDFLKSRAQLLHFLEELKQDKKMLLAKRREKTKISFSEKRKSYLKDIKKTLTSCKSVKPISKTKYANVLLVLKKVEKEILGHSRLSIRKRFSQNLTKKIVKARFILTYDAIHIQLGRKAPLSPEDNIYIIMKLKEFAGYANDNLPDSLSTKEWVRDRKLSIKKLMDDAWRSALEKNKDQIEEFNSANKTQNETYEIYSKKIVLDAYKVFDIIFAKNTTLLSSPTQEIFANHRRLCKKISSNQSDLFANSINKLEKCLQQQ